jgi:O-antigen/teichoic acid export membrane protein
MGLANAIWFVSIFFAAKPLAVIRPQFNWTIWKEAFYRSSPIAISTIFNLMYLRGDVLILAWVKPDDVPQYGTAYKVVDVLTAFPTMFMGLLLPQLTMAWTGKNFESFKKILQKAFDLFAIVVIPLFFGTQIVGPQLTTLIAGERYLVAGSILKVLIVAIVCVFISTLYGHTIVALHKQKLMTLGYALTAMVSIIGYLIFIPKFGMWGAAWVTCLSEFLIATLTFIAVSWVSKTWPTVAVAGKAVLSSFVMYLVLFVLPPWPVLIVVGVGVLVYLILMLGLGGFKIEDLKTLFPKNNQT